MPTVKETLIAARALIEDIEHWTQGSAAIENTGASVDTDSEFTWAFCASGAVRRVVGPNASADDIVKPMRFLDRAAMIIDPECGSIIDLNDGESGRHEGSESRVYELCHADVLAAFNRAIAAA